MSTAHVIIKINVNLVEPKAVVLHHQNASTLYTVAVTPKTPLLLLPHNCNFTTVMNCNVNSFGDRSLPKRSRLKGSRILRGTPLGMSGREFPD